VQECYRDVMVDEAMMLQGSGNQLEEKQETLYHYMRCDVNKFIDKPNWNYLTRILRDNPRISKESRAVSREKKGRGSVMEQGTAWAPRATVKKSVSL